MLTKLVVKLLTLKLQFNIHFIYFLSAIGSHFLFHVLLSGVISYQIIYWQWYMNEWMNEYEEMVEL
jgi:hypothetical protein